MTQNPFEGRPLSTPSEDALSTERLGTDALLGDSVEAHGPQRPPFARGTDLGAKDRLDVHMVWRKQPRLWLLGCHGGAGVTTLASLLGNTDVAESRAWPASSEEEPSHVILVARTHAHGLAMLRGAAAQWGSQSLSGIRLLGTVLVDDGPRLHRALLPQLRQAKGLTPRLWRLRWHEDWRLLGAAEDRSLDLRTRRTLSAILKSIDSPQTTPTK